MSESSDALETSSGNFGWVGLFIRRPVLASVFSLLIIVAGLAALLAVEVRELPQVDNPVVTVRTTYTGATPEAIDSQVTSIIEDAASQVQGVVSISSSSQYGSSRVVVEFSDAVDLDVAASDVRNAVSGVQRRLPEAAEDPVVVKADDDSSPVMRLAVSSETLDEGELASLIDDVILDRLAAVEGVAAANAYGLRERIVEVRLLPVELAARGLSVQEVEQAVSAATITAPAGALRNEAQELLVRAEAPIETPEEVGALYLNETTRLRDVALVRWALERPSGYTRLNGGSSAGIEILRQAQSNTIAISNGVKAAVEELQTALPPGVGMIVTTDDATFIEGSLREVVNTLILATVIVVAVMFLFMRSLRLTIVPTVTIPIALLGTLAAIWMMGFSINILTLLALVMATGLVVDDAIVVLENIERWRAMGFRRRAAALLGTKQIVFAVISTTATLAAVFVPISFLPGQAGKLFAEFGFVLACAVVISSTVALTLCPMLASRLAPSREERERPKGPLTRAYDRVGGAMSGFYLRTLDWCLKAPLLVVAAALSFAALAALVFAALPRELTPPEDRGVIAMSVSTQQGSNLEYLSQKVEFIEDGLQDLVDTGEVTNVLSFIGRRSTNSAFVIARLAPWEERERSQQEIQAELQGRFSQMPGVSFRPIYPNSLGIRGAGQGLSFAVAAPTFAAAADAAEDLAARLAESPSFPTARLSFDTTQPQLSVVIDREAATALGVPIEDVTTLVNVMIDEYEAAELFVADEIIKVMLSAGGRPINDPNDIENLFVRTSDGRFVNLSAIVRLEEVAIAPNLSREQKRRAVPINASLAEDVSLGDAVDEMRATAEVLSPDMSIILLGEAKVLQQSSDSLAIVFGFAVLIVLLVLAAQFESIISAIVIMVTVPFGLAAAVYAMWLTGGSLNYYSQIGLVLLIGIMAKNGILIVEFANQRRDEGASVMQAIRDAASVRLRPVMMTALSTVVGGIPLVMGFGAGAEAREALGWIVIGGLGFATIFTLYLTPIAFLALAGFSKPRATQEEALAAELREAQALLRRGDAPPAE